MKVHKKISPDCPHVHDQEVHANPLYDIDSSSSSSSLSSSSSSLSNDSVDKDNQKYEEKRFHNSDIGSIPQQIISEDFHENEDLPINDINTLPLHDKMAVYSKYEIRLKSYK